MSILGQFLGGVLKKKVVVPPWVGVSAQDAQQQAIAGNAAALPGASQLASQVNAFNQDQITGQLESVTPGLPNLLGYNSANIDALLRGEIPEDVAGNISRGGAARALEGGYGGAPRQGNLTARDLGLTSLQLKTEGAEALNRWLGVSRATMTSVFDPASMFLDPEIQLLHSTQERDKEFQRDFGSNQLKAAQAWQTILGNSIQDTDNMLTQTAMSAAGSAAGGGGGL